MKLPFDQALKKGDEANKATKLKKADYENFFGKFRIYIFYL